MHVQPLKASAASYRRLIEYRVNPTGKRLAFTKGCYQNLPFLGTFFDTAHLKNGILLWP